MIRSGFIAQEVEQAAKEIGYDFSGVDAPKNANDFYGIRYAEFVVPLVKAVQELSHENEQLKKKVEEAASVKEQVATLQKQVQELSAAMLKLCNNNPGISAK